MLKTFAKLNEQLGPDDLVSAFEYDGNGLLTTNLLAVRGHLFPEDVILEAGTKVALVKDHNSLWCAFQATTSEKKTA